MRYLLDKIKKSLKTYIQIAVVFGIAVLVLLYFLGYYDISFIDRNEWFGGFGSSESDSVEEDKKDPVGSGSDSQGKDSLESGDKNDNLPSDSQGGSDSDTETDSPALTPEKVKNTIKVYDEGRLDDYLSEIGTVSGYEDSGLVRAEETYNFVPNETTLAKMTFSFKLPTAYSLRTRDVVKTSVYLADDERGKVVEENYVTEDRPSVELYMGYIIIDKGENVILCSSDGTPLCQYHPDRFTPAYARDTEGRPLFKRHIYDVPDDPAGRDVYFYLSEDGKNFVVSDYDPEADSRGLTFDYPRDYGVSDSDMHPVRGEDGLYDYYVRTIWGGSYQLTGYNFIKAYPVFDGVGAVVWSEVVPTLEASGYEEDVYELYYGEYEPGDVIPANRGAMTFITQNGYRIINQYNPYYKEDYVRYVIEYLMPPLTDGVESIGYYYFDNGLARLRRQTIDWYAWDSSRIVRVISDEEILIRADGSEYDVPAGYSIEGYSDGVILLKSDSTNLYGFMDCTGGWIAQPIYSDATPFIEGLATLTLSDGRVGMIDVEGNIVLPFTYDSISQVSGGLILAYREENGWTVMRMMHEPESESSEWFEETIEENN
ncbi:MAG: hypothetical protein E7672_00585 [Ruminococcaceae bacterium]|nr:hypothetical protein [Oscillospiraceae bacterium]